MTKIKTIVARQIFDSRGNPTVETDVITTNGIMGRAAVPSGASTGQHEAVELRDGLNTYMGKSVFEAVKNVNDINLKSILKSRGLSTAVGDEGGFAPDLDGTEDAINTIIKAVEKAGYQMNKDVMIALDCAASEFYKDNLYDYSIFEKNNSTRLTSAQQVDFLVELCEKYPIISIEDGMDEDDWEGWKLLTDKIGDKVQLVGDDLFVTDISRLSKGINEKIGNSILIKFNQVGSLTETISAINLAAENNFTSVISHRSGETEDSTISDLCVAFNTGQIKTGSMSRSDRMSKYNQLLRIEEELADKSKYLGKSAFNLNL